MNPIIFHIGSFAVRWYGIMMASGFFAALLTWIRLGRRTGFSSTFCSDLLIWIMVSGILGARVAYVASTWDFYIANPFAILRVWQGGLVFYGGFIGSGVAIAVLARIQKIPFFELLDLVVPGLAIGHAFGRVGCFINHCCYGCRYEGIFSVVDPTTRTKDPLTGLIDMASGYRVHPVQLYESFANILIYCLLITIYRRRKKRGSVIAAYLLTYPVVRFALEYVRGDDRLHAGILTFAQTTSMVLFAIGLVILLMPRGETRRADSNTGFDPK